MRPRLGGFELVEPLASGGAAVVWRAVDVAEGLPAAVKVLQGRHARSPAVIGSFAREVRALAALDHAAIVRVFDHGEVDEEAARIAAGDLPAGAPWVALELASGGALSDPGVAPTTWHDLSALVQLVLDALAHAHARGVLHRDLKPANLLRRAATDLRTGPMLADFGLVTAVGHALPAGLARASTPAYAPPEQLDGDWQAFGPWTDLFALGATVWRLVVGRPYGQGAWAPRYAVPEDLRDWVEKLLEPRIDDRFLDVSEAVAAFPATVRLAPWPPTHDASMGGLPLAMLRRPRLVGRRDDVALLSARLDAVVAAARPHSVWLRAEAGSGRTAVLRGFAEDRLTRGSVFHVPLRFDDDDPVPAALDDALTRWWPHVDGGLVGSLRDAADGSEDALVRLVAALSARRPVLVTADDASGQGEALRRALASVAGPVLQVWVGDPVADEVDEVIDLPPLAETMQAAVLMAVLPLMPASALEVVRRSPEDLVGARRALVGLARSGGLERDELGRWALRPTPPSTEGLPTDAAMLRAAIDEARSAYRYDAMPALVEAYLATGPSPVDVRWARRRLVEGLGHLGSQGRCEAEGLRLHDEALAAGDLESASYGLRSVAVARMRLRRRDEALEAARQAAALARGQGLAEVGALVTLAVAAGHVSADEERRAATRALELATQLGLDRQVADAKLALASNAWRRGEEDEALRWLREVQAAPLADRSSRSTLHASLGDRLRARGDLDGARAQYEAILELAGLWLEGGEHLGVGLLNLALVELDAGRPAAARSWLRTLADHHLAASTLGPVIDLVTARCAVALDDLHEARLRLDRVWHLSRDEHVLMQSDTEPLLAAIADDAEARGGPEVAEAARRLGEHVHRRIVAVR